MFEPLATFTFERYASSVARFTSGLNYLAKGTKNLICLGRGKNTAYKGPVLQAGVNGSKQMMNAADGYAGLGEYNTQGVGSVFRVLAALFFIGAGLVRYNGASLATAATSTLSMLILSSGTFSGGPWQAGMAQPSAPDVGVRATPGTGFTGKVRGSVSVVVWRIRSTTGANSIKSPASAVVVADNQTLRVSVSALDSNGHDRWGYGVTQVGFGFSGPHFKLGEIADSALTTIDGIARSFEIEWIDADLVGQPLAPIEDFPPPAAVFGGALGDVTFVDGAYGDTSTGVTAGAPGSTIAVSRPLHPESFPGDNLLFPPEPPVNVMRGGDGYYYRLGKTSMGVITYTGGTPALALQIIWPNVGISQPHNACVGEDGRLYVWIGKPARIMARSEEPDVGFGDEVIDDFEGWADDDVFLGWDARRQLMCYINATQNKVMPFNTSAEGNPWSSPLFLTGKIIGTVCATVMDHRDLFFATNDGSVLRLYKFDGGTGTVVEVFTAWARAALESDDIYRVIADWRADNFANPVEMRILTDGDDNPANATVTKVITLTRTGLQHLESKRTRVNGQSHAIYLKQTCTGGNDAGPEKISTFGSHSGV
jgi:hypothetical protein